MSSLCCKATFLQSLKVHKMKIPKMNCQMTSCPSLQSSQLDTMENENTKRIWICRKIRIYPNKEQRDLFLKCLGAHRFFYNKANEYIKNLKDPKELTKSLSLINLRKKVMVSDKDLQLQDQWQKDIPYDTRQLAIKQLITSYKSSLALKKKGLIQSFDVAFLKKEEPETYLSSRQTCNEA